MKLDRQIEGALLHHTGIQAALIRSALRNSIDLDRLIEDWNNTSHQDITPSAARAWVKIHAVKGNRKKLRTALQDTLATGWLLGEAAARTRYARAATAFKAPSSDDLGSWLSTPWANWKPGYGQAAALLRNPKGKFKKILDDIETSLDGFDDTTMNRLGTVLADSLDKGWNAERTAKALNDVVDDSARSLTIARTETARAMSTATMDTYAGFGVDKVEWIHSDFCQCDLCNEAEDLGPQDYGFDWSQGEIAGGVTEPPMHPNCICAIAPVVDLGVEDSYAEIDAIDLSARPSVVKEWNEEDHPRDENGRFGSGGGTTSDTQGIPAHADLSGRRFDDTRRAEFRDKIANYENLRYNAIERVMAESGQDTRYISDEQRIAFYRQGESSPEVVAAREAVMNDPAYKSVAEQPAITADRTFSGTMADLGSGFETDIFHFDPLATLLQKGPFTTAEPTDVNTIVRGRDAFGNSLSEKVEVSLTADEIRTLSASATADFLSNAVPTYLTSNASLAKILSDDEVKSFVTADRSSKAGMNDVDYWNRRLAYENVEFGYKSTDPVRPISTYVTDGSGRIDPDNLRAYGSTQVVLNSDVTDRTTLTPFDSLNTWQHAEPWSSFASSPQAYSTQVAAEAKAGFKPYFGYMEAQVHGGISTSDISKVIFQDKAPVGLSSKLDKLGIPYEVVSSQSNKFDDSEARDEYGRWTTGGDDYPNWDTVDAKNPEYNAAFTDYQTSGYEAINTYLRTGEAKYGATPERIDETAKNLDGLIASMPPLSEDTTVYRGVTGDFANQLLSLNPGDSFTDKGFSSTTTDKGFAENAAAGGALIVVDAPAGTQGYDVDRFFAEPFEGEILLPRDTTYEVSKVEGNSVYVKVKNG